jgi:TonB family protein
MSKVVALGRSPRGAEMKLAISILAVAAALSASDHAWQTGKVLDANKTKSSAVTGADIQDNGHVNIQSTTVTNTYLVVVGSEFAYTVADTRAQGSLMPHSGMAPELITQAISNRGHGCRFIVNDDVKFYQDKTTLHVIDADGKECRTDIVRQERIVKPVSTQTAAPMPTAQPAQGRELPAPPPPRPTLRHDENSGTDDRIYRVGPGVSQPVVISKIDPAYTSEALSAKISGAVVVALVVGIDGKPHDIRVLQGLGMGLDEKAIESVERWRFQPGTKDGQPVNVRAQIQVNFRMKDDPTRTP